MSSSHIQKTLSGTQADQLRRKNLFVTLKTGHRAFLSIPGSSWHAFASLTSQNDSETVDDSNRRLFGG